MDQQTAEALQAFTQRYCEAWQQQRSSLPRSEELYGIPSPCVNGTDDDGVFWQPQPFSLEQNIHAVERALEIVVQQPLHAYYTTQFAGDMQALFADIPQALDNTNMIVDRVDILNLKKDIPDQRICFIAYFLLHLTISGVRISCIAKSCLLPGMTIELARLIQEPWIIEVR